MAETKCGFDDAPGGVTGRLLLATYGPTLLVDIGFDPNFVPHGNAAPIPGIKGVRALVDTGAGESFIDNLLAATLKLPIVDIRPISGSAGVHDANVYLAQICVPSLRFNIYGAFAGVDLAAGGQVHRALIGRTFLMHAKMVYDGLTGTVIISID